MNDTVLYAADNGVATITLNRPQVLNALNAEMVEGLAAVLDRIEADERIRAVVVKGAGNRFMAGGDIKFFTGFTPLSPEERRKAFTAFVGRVHPTILRLRGLAQPVIAAVHGPCAGFGMSLMMACDMALAAEDAVFTLAYIHLGLNPDGGSTFFLPRHVGAKAAMKIALLGERFDAATALGLGLVNEVLPAAALDERATALARRIALGPRAATAETKQLVNRSLGRMLESQLDAEAEALARCAASADFVAGVDAFVNKRPPRFGQ